MSGNETILVVIHNSWGEVDWILPVLVAARARLGVKVHLHFRFKRTLESAGEYTDLMELARRYAEISSGPEALKELADRLVGSDSPQWLLHDYSGNDFREIYDLFPESRVAVFPHGTSFEYMYYDDAKRKVVAEALFYHTIPRSAVFLHCLASDQDHFRAITDVGEHVVVGCPKFDLWWINSIRDVAGRPDDAMPGFLYLAWPKRKIAGEGYYETMMQSVAVVIREQGGRLHVRAHPRQTRQELVDALGDEAKHVRFVHTSILGAGTWASGIVSAPSCSAMDGITQGVPVVEFFNFADQNWPSFLCVDGETTSLCRAHDLVLPAGSVAELRESIQSIAQPGAERERVKASQMAALRKLVPEDSGATEAVLQIFYPAANDWAAETQGR